MKQLITILLCLFTLFAEAQVNTNDTNKYFKSYDYGFSYKRLQAREAFIMPTDTVINKLGAVSLNGAIYLGNGVKWTSIGGGGSSIDTTSLSNRINQRIDSLRRRSDSVFARKNGVFVFQYKDSVGKTIQGLDSVLSVYNRSINKNMFIGFDSSTYKGFGFYLNGLIGGGNPELVVNGVTNANYGIGIQANTNTNDYGKINFYNSDEGNKILQFPSGATSVSTINLPPISYNYTGDDTLAVLQNIRDAIGTPIDTANQFVNSVTSLNDTTIRVIKGTSTTDITIRSSATVTNATRLITTVYNNSGVTIPKGTVVYINGRHSSNFPTILPAQADNEQHSYKTFAIVDANIANNATGIVIQAGSITGLNLPTSTYTDGDIVYLSPTVAGGITKIKPLAPSHICKLGSVTRAHPSFGTLEIKIENGWQLDELSDVSIPAVPADSVILQFSRVDSLWHDVTINNAIGTRYLRPTDTAAMLTNYARTNLVNTKLNITDTSALQRKSIPAYSFNANNTNAAANVSAQAFRDTSGTYSGTITWTGTTAPSGTTNHSYRLTQVGKCVTLHIALVYATNGAGLTAVQLTLPAGAPTPVQPAGLTGSIFNMYPVSSQIVNSLNQVIFGNQIRGFVRNNTAANGFEIFLTFSTASPGQLGLIAQYWTN